LTQKGAFLIKKGPFFVDFRGCFLSIPPSFRPFPQSG
jgi:hypothetical protein